MNINHTKQWLLLGFAFLYILNFFIESATVFIITSVLLIIINIQSLPDLPKTTLRVSLGLYLLGSILLISNGSPISYWLEAVAKNAGLVTLFIFLPLISLPFFYENYQQELKSLAQRYMNSIIPFCLLTYFATHLLGIIILIGSPPIVYQILGDNARHYNAEKPFLGSIMQGMMAAGFWSPIWTSMIVITYYLDVSWLQLLPFGLVFALISLFSTIIWLYHEVRSHPYSYQVPQPDPNIPVRWNYVFSIIILALAFIITIMALDLLTSWSIIIIITIVAWLLPVIIALLQRKTGRYVEGLRNYYGNSLSRVKSEVVLFTAAGFFGGSLELTGISSLIPHILPSWLKLYPFISILMLMLIMVLFSLIGIHPVVSGTVLVGAINPLTLGLPVLIFALTILSGWAISVLLSPFSGNNLILSGIAGRHSWNISLGINGTYGIVTLVLLAVSITGIMYL